MNLEKLLKIPGVVGVGTGSLRVYLEDERYAEYVPEIPDTKLIVVGKPKPISENVSKVRPLVGGISISSSKTTAGTLGCFVTDLTDNETVLLTNWHVIKGEVGEPIFQPGVYDGGNEIIGFVKRYSKPDVSKVNLVDAAIGEIIAPFEKKIFGEIVPIGKTMARNGMLVRKMGRNGYSENFIIDSNATIKVYFPEEIWFREQILISQPFAVGGDSGSVVLHKNLIVGLLFAASNYVAIANRIENVEQELKIDVGRYYELLDISPLIASAGLLIASLGIGKGFSIPFTLWYIQ